MVPQGMKRTYDQSSTDAFPTRPFVHPFLIMHNTVPVRPKGLDDCPEEPQPRKRTRIQSAPGLVQRVVTWVQTWFGFGKPDDSDFPNTVVHSTPENIESSSHHSFATEDQTVPNLPSRRTSPSQEEVHLFPMHDFSIVPAGPHRSLRHHLSTKPSLSPVFHPPALNLTPRLLDAQTQLVTPRLGSTPGKLSLGTLRSPIFGRRVSQLPHHSPASRRTTDLYHGRSPRSITKIMANANPRKRLDELISLYASASSSTRPTNAHTFRPTSSRIIAPLQSALRISSALPTTPHTVFTPAINPEPWAATLRQRIVKAVTQRPTPIKPVTPALERLLAREARIDETISQRQQRAAHDNFPNLPVGAEEKILKALASHSVVEAFNIPIRGNDLQTLQDSRWLNDEIVNFYLNLLVQRSQTSPAYPTLHTFNTFFYSKLQEHGYVKVRRWSRKTDIFAKDLVIIPVHLPGHWTCIVVDMHNKCINYYDSMLGNNEKGFALIRSYLAQEYAAKKGGEFDFTGWQDCTPKDIPQQRNGHDCGVFSCTFAEYASRREPFDFTQDHMSYIRRRMMYEIITQSLLTKIV
ncbi:SUMO1 sentrin specific peptidase 1 [Dispira simplex]|nr:SUMO1 sentrin specific peptidase 1 [Dispira simplex]